MITLILDLVFKGKLPFPRIWFKYVFEYALPVALTLILAVGYYAGLLHELIEPLGSWSWMLLLVILFVLPISKILPDLGILRTISTLRRELGVGMFYFGLAHGASDLPKLMSNPWDRWPDFIWFGIGALLLTSLLYFTSNVWSMKILKKYWKWLHRLVYVVLLLVLAHLYALGEESVLSGIVIVGALIGLKVLNHRKFQLRLSGKI